MNIFFHRNTFKCPLVEMGDSYGCTFVADFDENVRYNNASFNSVDCFNVRLCYNIDCQSNLTGFEPFKNSKFPVKIILICNSWNMAWNNYDCAKYSWQICVKTNSLSSVQPTAPSHLAVQRTSEGYKCTWQSGYEHHPYITEFPYQLFFYKYHGNKSEVNKEHLNKNSCFNC